MNKPFVAQARLNELEQLHLIEMIDNRNKSQNNDIEYSISDIIRIALSLMYQVEITGEIETIYHPEIAEKQQEEYKKFWERHQKD